MTAIAKLLVFLTLVAGVGAAVFSTAVYTQRPGWFLDPPDGPVARGHVVVSFKGLAKEADAQGKAAAAAAALWGRQLRELKAAELDRTARAAAYAKLVGDAQKGATGFYEIKEDGDGRLLVLDPKDYGPPVKGPGGKALAGADTLVAKIAQAQDRITNVLTPKIAEHQKDQKRLGAEIDVAAAKLARQRVIREDLQNEASYLATAEVNVTEQAVTADRRKRQLDARLSVFRPLQ